MHARQSLGEEPCHEGTSWNQWLSDPAQAFWISICIFSPHNSFVWNSTLCTPITLTSQSSQVCPSPPPLRPPPRPAHACTHTHLWLSFPKKKTKGKKSSISVAHILTRAWSNSQWPALNENWVLPHPRPHQWPSTVESYGYTTLNAPKLVWSWKLSRTKPD